MTLGESDEGCAHSAKKETFSYAFYDRPFSSDSQSFVELQQGVVRRVRMATLSGGRGQGAYLEIRVPWVRSCSRKSK